MLDSDCVVKDGHLIRGVRGKKNNNNNFLNLGLPFSILHTIIYYLQSIPFFFFFWNDFPKELCHKKKHSRFFFFLIFSFLFHKIGSADLGGLENIIRLAKAINELQQSPSSEKIDLSEVG